MREAIDITKKQTALDSLSCFVCKGPTVHVETRQNSLIWYCQACDVFHETTATGVKLRSFRKEESQIVVLPEVGNGGIGV